MEIHTYNLVRNIFSQKSRTKLKKILARIRNKAQPLYKIRYGTFTAQDLQKEIEERIQDLSFDILMVHCSYGDISPMYSGGLDELLTILIEICDGKTLAMPAFFMGKPANAFNAREYYKENNSFDVKRAVSQTGLLSELFRRQPNTRRSLHPTHSICALGLHVDQLVGTHHLASSNFGVNTPFETMALHKTMILGIGAPYFRCLTQIHAPEDLLGERFPIDVYSEKIPVTLVDETGNKFKYQLSIHRKDLSRNLSLLRKLLSPSQLIEWKYHGIPFFAVAADLVTESMIDAALKGVTIYGNFA